MGSQGPAGTGIQGMGVKTPRAAAVAAATMGFAGLLHMPKGMIFRKGIISVMVPTGMGANTRGMGKKFKGVGAAPMVHIAKAPVTTTCPILRIHFYKSV